MRHSRPRKPVNTFRILGIDPGSRVTGVGVVESRGQSLYHVHSECVRAGDGDLGSRLAVIYERIQAVIDECRPHGAAIEKVFMAANPQAALILGHARGVALLAAVQQGLAVAEYSALEIKRAVVGAGSAGKGQVQHMVRVLLGMDHEPPQDAADALACAICHIHTAQGAQHLATAAMADAHSAGNTRE
ncbi:MAG: crossover junction endodeoxyribonuclease RuvC [Acidiferrobacteraceae bacterium]|nr:crossover junction endodeoxyribonuclease RuvC [Acidiferrobacteraceae bacterium]